MLDSERPTLNAMYSSRKGGRVLCGPHPDPSPRPSPFVFEGRRGVAAAAPAGWPWKAPGLLQTDGH